MTFQEIIMTLQKFWAKLDVLRFKMNFIGVSMRMSKLVFILAVAIVLSFSLCIAGEQSSDKENVAVLDFSGKNISVVDASIFSDMLRSNLVKMGTFDVVDKVNMEKILDEAVFQQRGYTDSDRAVQVGKILNVKKIVVGSLSKMGNVYYINASFVDVSSGKIEKSEALNCKGLEDLYGHSVKIASIFSEQDAGKIAPVKIAAHETKGSKGAGRKFAIGIGNPYLSIVIDVSRRISIEPRCSTDLKDVWVYALRIYYNLDRKDNYKWFGAIEYGHINFTGLDHIREGTGFYSMKSGYEAGAYVGGEYYMSPRVSFVMDIGPSYIDLNKGVATGIEWIVNTGIKFYL